MFKYLALLRQNRRCSPMGSRFSSSRLTFTISTRITGNRKALPQKLGQGLARKRHFASGLMLYLASSLLRVNSITKKSRPMPQKESVS